MSRTIPVGVPTCAVAGDTLEFDYSHSDFPVSEGWTAALILKLRGNIGFTSNAGHVSNIGDTYRFTIPAAELKIEPGAYQYAITFTLGSDRRTAETGSIEIEPNPAEPYKTYKEKLLEVVEARLQGRLVADIESYSIGGRSVSKIPIAQLRGVYNQLHREVYPELYGDTEIAFVAP